ncbi:MAG: cyclic nucleotide-binding domain-containing protein [Candidatus Sericytochromatia bacterium]|nr:cyclic nucleotide-binding domain-containing protein [Candidatus Sericytochromatia bacterium]
MDAEPIAVTDLPNESLEAIAQILAALFYYRQGISLEHHFESMKRLREVAIEVRTQIQAKGRSSVHLMNLYEEHGLDAVVYLSQVKAWLALQSQKQTYGKEPPTRCPACDMPLAQSWTCLACGLELESPYQRMQVRSSSQPAVQFLPFHTALLADPERRRLLFVNCREGHRVVWEIDAEQWSATVPLSPLYLENHHLLMVDQQENRVFEVNLWGKTIWEFKTDTSERHQLLGPRRVALHHRAQDAYLLIADTGNHRILMIDRHHRIHWQYGVKGEPGKDDGFLNSPTDVQLTSEGYVLIADRGNHRVLEINPDNNLITWESPQDLGLSLPTFAEKLPNHNLLVVDAGNYRVLELNPQGVPEEECVYFNQSLDPRFRMDDPLHYFRRENQNILLSNGRRIMEIDLIHKHALWVNNLSELRYEGHEDNGHTLDPNPDFVAWISKQDAAPQASMALNDILARTSVFQGAPVTFFESLTPYLTLQTFYPEDKIVTQGQTGDAMFILKKGKVQVLKEPETLLATLEAGDIFGEMALVLSEPRSATVKAVSNCEIYRLSKWAFDTALQPFPEVQAGIQKLAQSRAAITRLKTGKHLSSQEASEVLQALLDQQVERLQQIKAQFSHRSHPVIAFRPLWRLMYNKIEQHVIHEALLAGLNCFELHVHTYNREVMSQLQASHVVELLQAQGDLLKLHPSPEAIFKDLLDDTLALTLLTRHSPEQILDDLAGMDELAPSEIYSIVF